MDSAETIKGFQYLHVDHRGRPLKVDGKRGALTRWADWAGRAGAPRQLAAIRAARLLDIRERTGKNDHPAISWLFWRVLGRPARAAWCAAAASWCSSGAHLSSAQALGRSGTPTRAPALGDYAWYPTGSWQGHIGVVIAGDADTVMLIEGNRQNGGRLVRRRRKDLRFSDPFRDGGAKVLPPMPERLPITETKPYNTEGTR